MNEKTLEKLKKNPHYKMSENQRLELAKQQEEKRRSMVHIGRIHKHTADLKRD